MNFKKNKKPIIPLPYPYYFFTVAVIALAGLCDSIYLAVSHYRVYTDMGYKSFCAISRALNCDTVSQSPYSIFLEVPVAVWGIIGYLFFIGLLSLAWPAKSGQKRMWTLLLLISVGFTAYGIVLAAISTFMIQSYCIMCILSYAVNLLLVYFTWLIRKRFHCEPLFKALYLDLRYLLNFSRTLIPVLSIFAVAILVLMLFFPAYWNLKSPDLSKDIPTGQTQDGHPWIGAENPELTIIEFSDYRCFQCKKMHFFIRRLVEAYPDKIRLIHRHFPMDHTVNPIVKEPFHPGSGKLAIVSLFAADKQKFWEMNDLLFHISRQAKEINLRYFAQKTGIVFDEMKYIFRDKKLWQMLKRDIRAGLKHGLSGTPGFVINDQLYVGQIPAKTLQEYTD